MLCYAARRPAIHVSSKRVFLKHQHLAHAVPHPTLLLLLILLLQTHLLLLLTTATAAVDIQQARAMINQINGDGMDTEL